MNYDLGIGSWILQKIGELFCDFSCICLFESSNKQVQQEVFHCTTSSNSEMKEIKHNSKENNPKKEMNASTFPRGYT